MAFYYRAFGLIFQSSEPLPWLPDEPVTDRADVLIEFNTLPLNPKPEPDEFVRVRLPGVAPSSDPKLIIWQKASDSRFRFRYRNGTEFTVSADGKKIRWAWPERFTVEDAATYLLGPVTGFVLRLCGKVCLHASAVSGARGAFALMAPAGGGKSSSAAVFAKWGYTVVTDDILALEKHGSTFQALPGWPHLRLWPSSVAAIFGRPDALPRLCPDSTDWDKCYLDLTTAAFQFQTDPIPLNALYTVKFDPNASAVRVEPMGQMEALRTLLANTYSWYSLDGAMRAAEFDTLARLVQQVPVRCLTICGPDPKWLERQCRAIIEDAAAEGMVNLFADGSTP